MGCMFDAPDTESRHYDLVTFEENLGRRANCKLFEQDLVSGGAGAGVVCLGFFYMFVQHTADWTPAQWHSDITMKINNNIP